MGGDVKPGTEQAPGKCPLPAPRVDQISDTNSKVKFKPRIACSEDTLVGPREEGAVPNGERTWAEPGWGPLCVHMVASVWTQQQVVGASQSPLLSCPSG